MKLSKFLKREKKKIATLAICLAGYPIVLKFAEEFRGFLSPTLSKEQAYKVIEEEKEKIGMRKDIPISLIVYDHNELSAAAYASGASTVLKANDLVVGAVIISNKDSLDRVLIRHELYHLMKDNLINDRFTQLDGPLRIDESGIKSEGLSSIPKVFKEKPLCDQIKYLYGIESRATLYSTTGIKL